MSGVAFDVVLRQNMAQNPVRAVIYSGVLAVLDVGLNIALSGFLEAIFPAYDPKKNVWVGGLEAVAEIALHVVFANMFLLVGRDLFSTAGTLVPFGALVGIFLLGNALQKLYALQSHILGRVLQRMAKKAPKSTAQPMKLEESAILVDGDASS